MDRRGISRAVIAVAGTVAMLGVVASAAEIVRVSTLSRDGRLLVSFEMADGYTVAIHEAVLSGLPTTFSYAVELRRTTAFWFDRTVASAAVSVSVQYDNLTRIAVPGLPDAGQARGGDPGRREGRRRPASTDQIYKASPVQHDAARGQRGVFGPRASGNTSPQRQVLLAVGSHGGVSGRAPVQVHVSALE